MVIYSSSVALATFKVLQSHTWLVAIILDGAHIEIPITTESSLGQS